mmetsp:Transcript_33059/g.50578  ORF Transcript_33059/g.50578 Transcript_33059/m.50578 type:complete len:89 (-) Transcript_33059:76-342(-)
MHEKYYTTTMHAAQRMIEVAFLAILISIRQRLNIQNEDMPREYQVNPSSNCRHIGYEIHERALKKKGFFFLLSVTFFVQMHRAWPLLG